MSHRLSGSLHELSLSSGISQNTLGASDKRAFQGIVENDVDSYVGTPQVHPFEMSAFPVETKKSVIIETDQQVSVAASECRYSRIGMRHVGCETHHIGNYAIAEDTYGISAAKQYRAVGICICRPYHTVVEPLGRRAEIRKLPEWRVVMTHEFKSGSVIAYPHVSERILENGTYVSVGDSPPALLAHIIIAEPQILGTSGCKIRRIEDAHPPHVATDPDQTVCIFHYRVDMVSRYGS